MKWSQFCNLTLIIRFQPYLISCKQLMVPRISWYYQNFNLDKDLKNFKYCYLISNILFIITHSFAESLIVFSIASHTI